MVWRELLGLGPSRATRQPLILSSAKSRLRAPRLEDQREWSALRESSREFLQPWEPRWPSDHLSRPAFKRRVRWATAEANAERAFAFLIFDRQSNALVGGITISNIRHGPSRSASLGYWVGEAYSRKGYMRDAVERVAEFSFDTLGLVRLEAASLEKNTASRTLLERCGFQSEGVVRGYLEVNGTVRDHVLYSRLVHDPASRKSES